MRIFHKIQYHFYSLIVFKDNGYVTYSHNLVEENSPASIEITNLPPLVDIALEFHL